MDHGLILTFEMAFRVGFPLVHEVQKVGLLCLSTSMPVMISFINSSFMYSGEMWPNRQWTSSMDRVLHATVA